MAVGEAKLNRRAAYSTTAANSDIIAEIAVDKLRGRALIAINRAAAAAISPVIAELVTPKRIVPPITGFVAPGAAMSGQFSGSGSPRSVSAVTAYGLAAGKCAVLEQR